MQMAPDGDSIVAVGVVDMEDVVDLVQAGVVDV